MNIPPSGQQWTIQHDDARATVVEVGGGLREYQRGGLDILEPFPASAICDGAHNMPLVPWPNRVQDGRYRFDGRDFQLALTEPALHNAIHGFGRWRNWTLRARARDRLTVGLMIHPQPGYPFTLDLAVEYLLDSHGLTTRITATNLGIAACPYACGQHPYLACDQGDVDELELEFTAAEWFPTDDRQIPTAIQPVHNSDYDFRVLRAIGKLKLDYAFARLARDAEGRAWARIRSPSGRETRLWMDEHFGYLQLYTGDTLAPGRQRRSLAIEPMTCAPNGFRSGAGLIRLQPGESTSATWGLIDRSPGATSAP